MKVALSELIRFSTGACFAEFEYNVMCADKDLDKIDHFKRKNPYEPGLEALVQVVLTEIASFYNRNSGLH
jgi:UDP-glucose 6-dehydrogenase